MSKLIRDIRPDTVINIGDAADMPSLASYDKGKRSYWGNAYKKDIDAHLEFQSRLWDPVKAQKKRMPYRVFCEGNHEERISRALDMQPELEGTIGFSDLRIEDYYDTIVRYDGRTPGSIEIDGISYAHFFISGIMGRPIGGEHPAYSLLTKGFGSGTQGHSHLYDYCVRTTNTGRKLNGLICGVYQDYESDWAGSSNALWTRGITICRNVEEGQYDLQFISLESMRKEYGS